MIRTMIHVTKATPYVRQWLALIGVEAFRVVDGDIYAEMAIVPGEKSQTR